MKCDKDMNEQEVEIEECVLECGAIVKKGSPIWLEEPSIIEAVADKSTAEFQRWLIHRIGKGPFPANLITQENDSVYLYFTDPESQTRRLQSVCFA